MPRNASQPNDDQWDRGGAPSFQQSHARADHARADHARADHARADHARADHARTEQDQLAERLRHANRLVVVGQLAAGVVHDLNNVLLVVAAGTNYLRANLSEDRAAREELDVIDTAVDQAVRLVHQLLALARMQSAEPVTLDVNEAVRRIEPLLRRLLGRRISLRLVTAPHVRRVRVRPGEIEQVLVNLVANARDAMPNGGRLVVETADVLITHHAEPAALPVPAGWYVRLTVRDTGEGMDDVTRSRVFDPFFTTKAAGSGTGLGLSTVHRIVTESGGYVDVESTPGEGSAFTILLPAVDDAVRRAA